MPINESLVPEYDFEMATTRKLLDRVPDENFSWKPHEKSFSMGALATHMARIPSWTKISVERESLDLAAPGDPGPVPATKSEVLALFDQNAKEGRAALMSASDQVLFQPWSLKNGDAVLMTLPKVAVIRSFVVNHIIHHRGQLSVYLRLLDIPVPAIYGPSADEAAFR